jgi:hypothetical protein
VGAFLAEEGGSVLEPAVPSSRWISGVRYDGGAKTNAFGSVGNAPAIDSSLLDGKKLFVKSRPQYDKYDSQSGFLSAHTEGIKNDGTGDQTDAINKFLLKALSTGKVAFFPAGIYQVQDTVFIPTGSRIVGSSWSQIMGTGPKFGDLNSPKVMVRVGNDGDVGSIEISEMLWTVKGPTQGAILMEWNVHETTKGSAAMWDCHFRVGGAKGSDLDATVCPKGSINTQCIAATLLFHVTAKSSGYFENVWVWTADHDGDMRAYDMWDTSDNQISVFTARGLLVESQGPSWFYGGGSEHSVLYQYQLYNARNIYMGHVQSETPYYQPQPQAPAPFNKQQLFPGDPDFSRCRTSSCKAAWALRIVNSANIYMHGVGLYSFFTNYDKSTCVDKAVCQDHLLQVKGSKNISLFNIFTIGSPEVAKGAGGISIPRNATQR